MLDNEAQKQHQRRQGNSYKVRLFQEEQWKRLQRHGKKRHSNDLQGELRYSTRKKSEEMS